jgi:hypothetical protein
LVYNWRNVVLAIELIGGNQAYDGHGNNVSRSLWGNRQQWHAGTQAPKRSSVTVSFAFHDPSLQNGVTAASIHL